MPQPAAEETIWRYTRKLERRIVQLERELRGLRSERRPRLRARQNIYKATVNGAISPGGSGAVTVYKSGEATSWQVTAFLDWAHGNEIIPATINGSPTQVWIIFRPDQNQWVIFGKDWRC